MFRSSRINQDLRCFNQKQTKAFRYCEISKFNNLILIQIKPKTKTHGNGLRHFEPNRLNDLAKRSL